MNAHLIQENGGESKARKRKSNRNCDPWYKRNPQDFHDGTRELSLEERGAYNDIVDMIYIHGGALTMSDRVIAGKLVIHPKKWATIKQRLIETKKLFLTPNGHLHNERAEDELIARHSINEKRSLAARPRRNPASTSALPPPSKPAMTPRLNRDGCEKPHKNNEPATVTPTYTRDLEREKRERESELDPFSPVASAQKDDLERVRFSNGKLELLNGLKSFWLTEFEGDEKRLELGLIQAAGFVQPHSPKPLEAQVGAQLARQCADRRDRDKRYAAATERNAHDPPAKRERPKTSNEIEMAELMRELIAPVMAGYQ